MKKGMLSVSIMCCDLLNLQAEIMELERQNIELLHVDIMDSSFVPNLTFGIDTVNRIKGITSIPLDIHLLVEKPSRIIQSLNFGAEDLVTIHAECSERIMENVAYVKQKGARFGLALNPDTTVEEIEKYLPYLDVLNIMLIVPGFAGSTMIHGIMEKVKSTRSFLDEHGYRDIEIEVDGSVSEIRARTLKEYGANIFVGGTAGIFKKGEPISRTIPEFRKSIG
jgi:ribulose-phosphate 3-epimerase